jgi:hypothetical protein
MGRHPLAHTWTLVGMAQWRTCPNVGNGNVGDNQAPPASPLKEGKTMRYVRSCRLLAFMLLLMLGLGTLPLSPAVAAKCATIGPGANLNGCDLSGMDLSGVNLSGANLRGANLEGTNLDGANLSGANLNNARVTEGALDNADTAGANLRGITWVPGARITSVFIFGTYPSADIQYAAVTGTGFTPGA